jgi:hypothetical protein
MDVPEPSLQSEGFSPPNSEQTAKGAQFVAEYHGYDGPVQVTNPNQMYGGPQQPAFISTMVNLTGISLAKDINGGSPNGVSITPLVRNILRLKNHSLTFNRQSTGVIATTDRPRSWHT